MKFIDNKQSVTSQTTTPRKELRLLALDGGGVRGLPALIIL